jgi:tetratricopeptide (TPR) repeat protein
MRACLGAVLCVVLAACASTKKEDIAVPVDYDPDDPLAATSLMQQGQALLAEGRPEAALAKYGAAIKLQPNNPTAHNLYGLALLQLNKPSTAIETFNRALTLAPTYSDARNNRGVAYMQLGQASMAESDFLVVLGDRTYANRTGVFFNLGALYLGRGNLTAAEENLRRAAVPAGPLEAYIALARVEQRLGKLEPAEAALRDAMARAPERPDIPLELGQLLDSVGRHDEAREMYRRVTSLAPESTEAAEARKKLGGE